jgi:hypothetical protein
MMIIAAGRSSLIKPVLGVGVPLLILYFVSGGFILYLNSVLIAIVSTPVIKLAFEIGILSLAFFLVVRAVYRKVASDSLKAFLITVFLIVGLYSLTSLWLFILVSILALITVLLESPPYLGRGEWALLISGLAVSYTALVILSLYTPIDSGARIEVVDIPRAIDVNGLARFIPLMTAYAYAVDRIQVPGYSIYPGDAYVYFFNMSLVYSWAIEPYTIWNRLSRGPVGVAIVHGDSYPPNVEIIQRDMVWGLRNMRFHGYIDDLYREVVLNVCIYCRPILNNAPVTVYRGEILVLIPIVAWDRGLLYSIPILKGYAVVHQNGLIEALSPLEAMRDPRFSGIPLVPEQVAREWAELVRHRVGFLEYYIFQRTFVIRDVGENPQPYLTIDGNGNSWWVFVAEPSGEVYSAKYILYINTSTLKPSIYIYTLQQPAIGVSRVESYVKQIYPQYDWSQLRVEEPIPVILNGTIYWKATVVTNDYRGLVSVVLIDAKAGQARTISLADRKSLSYVDAMNTLIQGGVEGIKKEGRQDIVKRIENLEKLIQSLRSYLDELEKELEGLKRQMGGG